jgi:hypothetical protein
LGVDAHCPRVNQARKSKRVAGSTGAAAYEKQSQVTGGKEQDRSVQEICYLPRQGRARASAHAAAAAVMTDQTMR